ncbi:alpha/beta hydrolase family protein [Spirosoma utsteinense]|uniref:alpha/beta hydrolase family protein n=1 Tax=Spirosoma utsteinense TaxID=2585773 RepID=UPI0016466B2F|nr:alpha/beta fold hydrolase [Spirosoma utsteinense]
MKKNVLLGSTLVILTSCLIYLVWLEKSTATRPQEPKLPYPYRSQEVRFQNNQASINLSGTLTLPAKADNVPAVILITGSGPQDRNEAVFGHRPFLVIADYLTRHGFAVLRYDDRGIGQSTGNFMTATSLDFAADAESAVAYLKTRKEINQHNIGLVGHSKGGLIAAIAASHTKEVSFVISLAGPGVICIDVMHLQTQLIARAGGVDESAIVTMNKTNHETAD